MNPSGLILTLERETPPITLSLTTIHSTELIGGSKLTISLCLVLDLISMGAAQRIKKLVIRTEN